MILPSFDFESKLLANARYIAGMDEVGRGALAGPAAVGVVVIDLECGDRVPEHLTDSKLLTPKKREQLYDPVRNWAVDCAVGWVSAETIDQVGISAALGIAGRDALARLSVFPQLVILDGNYDWLTPRDLLAAAADNVEVPSVITRIKADRDCVSVAAASVLAKVERDRLMVSLDCGYGWKSNMGYGSVSHRQSIKELGLSTMHRASFCRKILEGDDE